LPTTVSPQPVPVGDLRTYAAGDDLTAALGSRPGGSLFILAGWIAELVTLGDGRRQIIAFRLPGDFTGPAAAGVETVFLTYGRTVDGTPLQRLQVQSPGGAASMVSELLKAEEEGRLRQQIVRLGRCSAYERTAHLLLELHERLLEVGLAHSDGFHLPITQEILADALGLSIVHVNRTLQQLRREGQLVLRGSQVTFPDRQALASAVHYALRPATLAAPGVRRLTPRALP